MSTTISIHVPPAIVAPRGAQWAAHAAVRLLLALRTAFAASPATTTPTLRDRAREAESVRRLAASVQAREPSFAADLYAAAARHESLEE
jgi:hypothetical protein